MELETSWWGRVARGDGGYSCLYKGAEEGSTSAILRLRSLRAGRGVGWRKEAEGTPVLVRQLSRGR